MIKTFSRCESVIIEALKTGPKSVAELEEILDRGKVFSSSYMRVLMHKINNKIPIIGAFNKNGIRYLCLKPDIVQTFLQNSPYGANYGIEASFALEYLMGLITEPSSYQNTMKQPLKVMYQEKLRQQAFSLQSTSC